MDAFNFNLGTYCGGGGCGRRSREFICLEIPSSLPNSKTLPVISHDLADYKYIPQLLGISRVLIVIKQKGWRLVGTTRRSTRFCKCSLRINQRKTQLISPHIPLNPLDNNIFHLLHWTMSNSLVHGENQTNRN